MASRWLKLWTASVFTAALLPGLGCQAHHEYAVHQTTAALATDGFLPEPAVPPGETNIAPRGIVVVRSGLAGEDGVTLSPLSRYWGSTPTARIFRGSVSSVSNQNDLIAR
jgi:hypothetical protein